MTSQRGDDVFAHYRQCALDIYDSDTWVIILLFLVWFEHNTLQYILLQKYGLSITSVLLKSIRFYFMFTVPAVHSLTQQGHQTYVQETKDKTRHNTRMKLLKWNQPYHVRYYNVEHSHFIIIMSVRVTGSELL